MARARRERALVGVEGTKPPEAVNFFSIFIQNVAKSKDLNENLPPRLRHCASRSHNQPYVLVNGGARSARSWIRRFSSSSLTLGVSFS